MLWILIGGALCLLALLLVWKRRAERQEQPLEALLAESGFAYSEAQDIFIARHDAWQRDFGYCRAFDEAAAPLGLYLDSEPVYFDWDGRRWLIEFWKGQYGLCTGAEVGIYSAPLSELPDTLLPFASAASEEELPVALTLLKGARTLFKRRERHWWLTGFVLGEFSEPAQLTAHIELLLKNRSMCRAFTDALAAYGYTPEEFQTKGRRVRLTFTNPHSEQPFSRDGELAQLMQRRNGRLCALYRTITDGIAHAPEQLACLREKHPGLYGEALRLGRPRGLYGMVTAGKDKP